MACGSGSQAIPVRPPSSRGILVMLLSGIVLARAASAGADSASPQALGAMITTAAVRVGIAPELLAAVAWVESRGRPWALGIDGHAVDPRSYAEAVAVVREVEGRADIGLAQIHYPIWGPVFGLRPEDLLDPWINLHVAARILRLAMRREPGSWGGVGRYHSATPSRKWEYARRVAAVVRALRPERPGAPGVSP